ncbi:MAG: cysteine desulfurase [Ruminococcus sp.]|nr:cysteine desulfurase [Ruminococcus sp.]
MIYFDNAATTAPSSEVCRAVAKGLKCFGNPSSLHRLGLDAEKLLNSARENIAAALGANPQEIYFTSGATESNNTAIIGAAKKFGKRKKKIVTTSVEHPSVAEVCTHLENEGFKIVRVSPNAEGKFNASDIINAVDDNTFLVTCMYVNNENGFILPVEKVFSAIKKRYPHVLTHCDCVQAFMKIPFKAKKLNADLISLSAHKIHGPKGIGALYVKKGVNIPAFIVGGGQEKAFRSGTESIPLICGFSAAVEELCGNIDQRFEYVKSLQSYLFEKCGKYENIHVNSDADCSPYVNSIAVNGLKSEVLLHFLEEREIFVSSGSACSKGKKSSVLQEFKVSEKYLDSTIRISFSKDNTKNEIDILIKALDEADKKLCKIR